MIYLRIRDARNLTYLIFIRSDFLDKNNVVDLGFLQGRMDSKKIQEDEKTEKRA